MRILLPLLVALLVQEIPEKRIQKSEAAPYRAALQKFIDAKNALDKGDITTAYDKSTEIFEDTSHIKTDNRECMLKLQNSDSTWNLPAEFFPVKVRCSAMVSQAKKQIAVGKKDDARGKLQAAEKDIAESIARNVPGSADLLKEIKKILIEIADNEEDPAVIRHRAYDAKVKEALKAKDDGKLELAKQLFEEAIKIDDMLSDAKDGLTRVEALIKEEAAFTKYKTAIVGPEATMDDLKRKADACDAFLKEFASGSHATEVSATRETISNKMMAKESDAKRKRELAFENEWTQLRSKGKYKDAIAFLKKPDPPFGPDRLKEMETETIQASDAARDSAVDRLMTKLGGVDSFDVIVKKSLEAIERDFTPPDDADLIHSHAAFAWFNGFKGVAAELRAMGSDADPVKVADAVKQLWGEAQVLVDKGENLFFKTLESLVRDVSDRRLRTLVKNARTASTEELKKIRAEANAVVAKLDELDGKLPQGEAGKAWRDANSFWGRDVTDLKAYLNDFPVTSKDLDDAAKALTDWEAPDGVYGKAPQAALERIERDLQNVDRNVRNLSRDERRRLFTLLVVARAMRLFLDGKKVDDVVMQIGDLADELKKIGGPLADEVSKYGPKVEKVFAAMK